MNSNDLGNLTFINTNGVHGLYPDNLFRKVRLFDLFLIFKSDFEFTDYKNNKIVVQNLTNTVDEINKLKNIYIYIREDARDNTVILDGIVSGYLGKIEISLTWHDNVILVEKQSLINSLFVHVEGHHNKINIRKNGMFSSDIEVHLSSTHGLYDAQGKKKNTKKFIEIGEHVWIGRYVRILAGAQIGDSAVIGTGALVAGKVPNNATAAGVPAKVLGKDVFWTMGDWGEDYLANQHTPNHLPAEWHETEN